MRPTHQTNAGTCRYRSSAHRRESTRAPQYLAALYEKTNSTISWRIAATSTTSSRFSKRPPHIWITQRSCPRIRLPAIRSTSLNQRFLCHFLSSLHHRRLSSSHGRVVLSMFLFRSCLSPCLQAWLLGPSVASRRFERLHSQATSRFIRATLPSYPSASCHS